MQTAQSGFAGGNRTTPERSQRVPQTLPARQYTAFLNRPLLLHVQPGQSLAFFLCPHYAASTDDRRARRRTRPRSPLPARSTRSMAAQAAQHFPYLPQSPTGTLLSCSSPFSGNMYSVFVTILYRNTKMGAEKFRRMPVVSRRRPGIRADG